MLKQTFKWLVVILVCIIPTMLLSSCSDEDEKDDSVTLSQNEIIGTWNGKSENYNTDNFEFFDDGSAVRKYGNGLSQNSDHYQWQFAHNILSLTDEQDVTSEHSVNYKNNQLSFESDGTTYYKTVNLEPEPDNPSSSSVDKKLVGEWWYRSSSDRLKKIYLCANGKGYEINIRDDKDFGIYYRGFVWDTPESGMYTVRYDDGSTTFEYQYSIDGNECLMVREGKYKESWSKKSNNADESFDPNQIPFPNNYLLNRITGYYYEIAKVTSGCDHAGPGDNYNEQFLHFFGSTEQITTTGLRIVYYTPRWEGIDSYWASGTYKMSLTAGAYRYSSMAWCNGVSLDTYDGRLKISRTKSFTTYDYDDEDVKLHVLVQSN